MFIELTRPVDDLRLRAGPGFVTAVMAGFGGELVAAGHAVELTREEFHRRLVSAPSHSTTTDRFELVNDRRRLARHSGVGHDRNHDGRQQDVDQFAQRPLFTGLECLSGQLDLFPTDGGGGGGDGGQ